MPTPLDQWFVEEVLPHEGLLMRYLTRVWRNSSDLDDIRQEAYVRVYEAARTALPSHPKALLFTSARNLMIDRLRRQRVVAIESLDEFQGIDEYVDEITPERSVSARQEFSQLAHAFNALSENCKAVIWLRRIEGISQRDTATQLGLNERAVEGQLARGLRALAHAVMGASRGEDSRLESEEPAHGTYRN